jgi:hypothetical protein
VQCWGGFGSPYGRISAPVGLTARKITAGFYHSCAITAAGGVHCWGDDAYGEAKPPLATESALIDTIIGGYRLACAQSKAGVVSCWGTDRGGKTWSFDGVGSLKTQSGVVVCSLTDGRLSCFNKDALLPAPVFADQTAKIIDFSEPGSDRVCAIFEGGKVLCYLFDSKRTIDISNSFPERVQELVDTAEYVCALTVSGRVFCFLPVEFTTKLERSRVDPKPPADLRAVKIVAGKHWRACAITVGDKITCWTLQKDDPNQEIPEFLRYQ